MLISPKARQHDRTFNYCHAYVCRDVHLLQAIQNSVSPFHQRTKPRTGGAAKTKEAGGYGAGLKDDYRRFYGTTFGMNGRGVGMARYDNYCEIDPNVVDKYGIPVLRFHYKWTSDEINQARHMQETFSRIIHEMGAIPTSAEHGPHDKWGLEAPGRIIHEVGTTRMGNERGKSVLNKWCQAHDCKNLFVVDGAPTVQQSDKNATWTILALSMRTAEYMVTQARRLNV